MLMQKLLCICFDLVEYNGLCRSLNSNTSNGCTSSAAVELLILLHGSVIELNDVKLL